VSKLKYDLSKATAGGDWEHVPPGVYTMKVMEVNARDSKAGNPMLEVVLKPVADAEGGKLDGEFNQVWHYILTDGTQDSRYRAFIDAVGLKAKGTLDTDDLAGSLVLAHLKSDKDQDGEYRPRVSKVMATEVEVEDEEADEEDEEEGIDLAELDRAALRALIKSEELGIRVLKSMSDEDLRDAIAEALAGPEEEPEDEEEEDEEEDEDEGVDLTALNRNDLKKFIKDNELEIRVLKSMSDDDIRSAIADAGNVEDEEESENGYDSMSIADLKAALKERGLSTSGAKKVLVGRLTEDDQSGDDPF
jgi:hypothetical protein